MNRTWTSCMAAFALVALSCSRGASGPEATSETTGSGTSKSSPPRPAVYVVVAASDALGYGAENPDTDAWPRVLARTALPPRTTVVNLGIAGATVATALEHEVPAALQREPTIVMVWLNVNDILASVAVDDYERRLFRLVSALRRDGRTRVLVANTPPLDRLPFYLECQSDLDCLGGALPGLATVKAAVAAYNDAIARVVTHAGAELVDLHAAGLMARNAGMEAALVGKDGFHPSTLGHQTVASTFARVLRPS